MSELVYIDSKEYEKLKEEIKQLELFEDKLLSKETLIK